MTRRVRGRGRGAATLETAIIILAVLLLFGLLVGFGRYAAAQTAVTSAANAGARAASLERGGGAAVAAAASTASRTLTDNRLGCAPQISTTGNWSAPAGTPATAHTEVSCTVPLGDLSVPGFPGSVTLRASQTQVIDTYRGRNG